MNTSVQKLNLIHWITELQDNTILDILEVIQKQGMQEDWWNTISIAEKSSIEKGISDIGEGRVVAHSEVKKRYEKWLIQ
jgi:hypothetical protein